MEAEQSLITGWHAHVYYRSQEERQAAERIRTAIGARFPDARLGSWHDEKVGPHSEPMYQISFGPELFPTLVPWLMLNREGLAVLVHPDTGRPRDDHLKHAAWLGAVLPIDATALLELDRRSKPRTWLGRQSAPGEAS